MSTVNQRLSQVVETITKSSGVSKTSIANAIGIDRAYLSRLLSGKANVSDSVITAIVKTYNVNREWLEEGNDEMFIGNEVKDKSTTYNKQSPTEMNTIRRINDLENEMNTLKDQISMMVKLVNHMSDQIDSMSKSINDNQKKRSAS